MEFLFLTFYPIIIGCYTWWVFKEKEDLEKLKRCQCKECIGKKLPTTSRRTFIMKLITWCLISVFVGFLQCKIDNNLGQLTYMVTQVYTADPEKMNTAYEILGVPRGASKLEKERAFRARSRYLHPDKPTGSEKEFIELREAYETVKTDEPIINIMMTVLGNWMDEKVLEFYVLVFLVLSTVVSGLLWWYTSIQDPEDEVLLDTIEMYSFFFHKTPSMPLKRVIMILAASLEFMKKYNCEIVERQSDNEEVPHLITLIGNLGEKNKERPLCYMYSIKARALLYSHLSRIPLNPLTLDRDRMYIVRKCPYLIQEMVNCVSQIIMLGYACRVHSVIRVETIESCMKLCSMIVQALWEFKSPLLQLPHINEDDLKYFLSNGRNIKSIQQFVQLKNEDRRSILIHLSEEQYSDVMKVVGKMPLIDFQVKIEAVVDDEACTVITAGAIVTVTCTLYRQNMSVLFGDETAQDKHCLEESTTTTDADTEEKEEEQMAAAEEDDDDWVKFQSGIGKRERVLEGRSKMSHSVHCPHFPEDKQEYWWVYVSDRTSMALLTYPYLLTSLGEHEFKQVQLMFKAPKYPGVYTLHVSLRSDSYVGFHQVHEIKLDVKEAPWEFSEEEEESSHEGEVSHVPEFTSDEDD